MDLCPKPASHHSQKATSKVGSLSRALSSMVHIKPETSMGELMKRRSWSLVGHGFKDLKGLICFKDEVFDHAPSTRDKRELIDRKSDRIGLEHKKARGHTSW